MNERTFKAKLRDKFKAHCYVQSMSSLGTAGTPDLWLSHHKDIWIEVKYDDVTKRFVKPKLTALQRNWLDHRRSEGRSCAVIVGTAPNEAILYRWGEWNEGRFDRKPLDEIIDQVIRMIN